jgi:hypothetical protein
MSEEKRKKIWYDNDRIHSNANIGDQIARWSDLKEEIVASDHAAVAKYLLPWIGKCEGERARTTHNIEHADCTVLISL